MKILHVVRRFGPVGGMERYVWEIAQSMRDQGHQVAVVCEQVCCAIPYGLEVHALGTVMPRPRWLALLRFGMRARNWIAEHARDGWVVHSHERMGCHDVTTFHGPPFATIFEKHWMRWPSLRVLMHLFLEWRELSVAKRIIPVSDLVAQQLAHYYPWLAHKLVLPVVPGLRPGQPRAFHLAPAQGGVIGFVGKEWRRKGLARAVEIARQLREQRPDLRMVVIGPTPDEIRHLFAGWKGGYCLMPETGVVPYHEFDVLLHPARAEPYGMVITEAMGVGVPVVVSDACGARHEVLKCGGAVLSLSADTLLWSQAVQRQLTRTREVRIYQRAWDVVARESVGVYGSLGQVPSNSAQPHGAADPSAHGGRLA